LRRFSYELSLLAVDAEEPGRNAPAPKRYRESCRCSFKRKMRGIRLAEIMPGDASARLKLRQPTPCLCRALHPYSWNQTAIGRAATI